MTACECACVCSFFTVAEVLDELRAVFELAARVHSEENWQGNVLDGQEYRARSKIMLEYLDALTVEMFGDFTDDLRTLR
ncbi:hypothetical protein EON66_08520 [archaeon]|nr:MAG: hypothetical protein EON66_08520 [archaeon]